MAAVGGASLFWAAGIVDKSSTVVLLRGSSFKILSRACIVLKPSTEIAELPQNSSF